MKTSNPQALQPNRRPRKEGLPIWMLGRALRASYPKRHTSQGTPALNQGERKADKWGRRGRGAARVWRGEGLSIKWQVLLFKNKHSGRVQGRLEGAFAPRNSRKNGIHHFATGCPGVRAAGPAVTRSGCKGVEQHDKYTEMRVKDSLLSSN